MFELEYPTPIDPISLPLFSEKKVEVYMKREDLIDSEISGNKWRKLKYNLIEAKAKQYSTILTFGGAFSNHIAATAAACKSFGFKSIGIIRGDELNAHSNPTLQQAAANGMDLQFISRKEYQNRNDETWVRELEEKYQAFVIPEGGTNHLALKGVEEIMHEITEEFDAVLCPVGTGGTLSGIINGLDSHQKAIGISSLKGESYLNDMISDLTVTDSSWELIHDYHFGGYARFDSHLIKFINQFYLETQIPLDPVYTGKMMYGLVDMMKNGKFSSGSRLICVHTGGLQGIVGFNRQHKNLLIT
ncbi:1-aminocyclopropane-1-carboxylate deaminase/D-cysteine desulfhydrase [Reichenbachiella sp.]|uniref:1-aminocyclopropane-1-carboxylate deaminase/D-cysteine desulfhydrase n=1 Tax=Reichenbachiella sp. TaxID=2184521 RepID=UPI003B59DDC0